MPRQFKQVHRPGVEFRPPRIGGHRLRPGKNHVREGAPVNRAVHDPLHVPGKTLNQVIAVGA